MDFSKALIALKQGKKMTRKGWNGKGMWLRVCEPYSDKHFQVTELEGAEGTLMAWIGIKTTAEQFTPWTPSHTDLFADDWEIQDGGMNGLTDDGMDSVV